MVKIVYCPFCGKDSLEARHYKIYVCEKCKRVYSISKLTLKKKKQIERCTGPCLHKFDDVYLTDKSKCRQCGITVKEVKEQYDALLKVKEKSIEFLERENLILKKKDMI